MIAPRAEPILTPKGGKATQAPPPQGDGVLDLRPWARARRYRVRLEASFSHESDNGARGDGRAYVEVVCRRGLIYPYDGTELLAWTSTRGILGRLRALDPGVRVCQAGDLEAAVRFPSRLLDAVAAVLRPRRRRTLDPARACAIGRGTAFPGAQACEDDLGRDGAGSHRIGAEVRR